MEQYITIFRSSHQMYSVKKGVLRSFKKFTGKHLCQSLFFNKVAGRPANFIKKGTLAQVFSCEFCEFSKNTSFTEHLWATGSLYSAVRNRRVFQNSWIMYITWITSGNSRSLLNKLKIVTYCYLSATKILMFPTKVFWFTFSIGSWYWYMGQWLLRFEEW